MQFYVHKIEQDKARKKPATITTNGTKIATTTTKKRIERHLY